MRLTASFPMGGAGEEIVESCLKLLKGKKKKKKHNSVCRVNYLLQMEAKWKLFRHTKFKIFHLHQTQNPTDIKKKKSFE